MNCFLERTALFWNFAAILIFVASPLRSGWFLRAVMALN